MKDISKVAEPMKAVGKKKAARATASQHKRPDAARETIGIDLGDKVSRYAILDASGELVEEGSFRNVVSSIEKHFGGDTKPARIAMEVGTQSAWIERELKRLGHDVIVANARELAWITSSDTKNDRSDAEKLARLARADLRLLKPVDHRTAEQQAELSVIRARDALVRARTLLVNTARGLAKGFGFRLPAAITSLFGTHAMKLVPEILKPALSGLLAQVDALTARVKEYDRQIAALAAQHQEVTFIQSIPGVGPLSALTFVLTLGRADRFERSRDVGVFFGMRPKQRQSGDCDPQLHISKAGDKYVRKLLVQCAHHILGRFGKDSALRQWGLKIAQRGSKNALKRAIVAVARKLAVLMHRLWRKADVFQPFPLAA
jgi:transposase